MVDKNSLTVKITFTDQEMDYIHLRYGKALTLKEISMEMNLTERAVKYYSSRVVSKLGLIAPCGDYYPSIIKATKLLIKHGLIGVEEEE